MDIMSDRSSKEKSPEVHSSRNFEEDELNLLTTRTAELEPKVVEESIEYSEEEHNQIYIEEVESPRFIDNTYMAGHLQTSQAGQEGQ